MMDREEAKRIIQTELESFRAKAHAELVRMIDAEPLTGERAGPSGKQYQFEIHACWDGKPDGDIRVMGLIDDGGLRAFFPLTECFIKSPSDEFVDE